MPTDSAQQQRKANTVNLARNSIALLCVIARCTLNLRRQARSLFSRPDKLKPVEEVEWLNHELVETFERSADPNRIAEAMARGQDRGTARSDAWPTLEM
jgi:hypothetical protein